MGFESKKVYLLLGSNLGDRKAMIDDAVMRIGEQVGPVTAKSSYYETAAWGKTDQPAFLNVALCVHTHLTPVELLEEVLGIELQMGRIRQERWGTRLIDIDIILYNNEVIEIKDRLSIPHPEMQNRRFVLEPLAEIAEAVRHPVLNLTVIQILQRLKDNLMVSKI